MPKMQYALRGPAKAILAQEFGFLSWTDPANKWNSKWIPLENMEFTRLLLQKMGWRIITQLSRYSGPPVAVLIRADPFSDRQVLRVTASLECSYGEDEHGQPKGWGCNCVFILSNFGEMSTDPRFFKGRTESGKNIHKLSDEDLKLIKKTSNSMGGRSPEPE